MKQKVEKINSRALFFKAFLFSVQFLFHPIFRDISMSIWSIPIYSSEVEQHELWLKVFCLLLRGVRNTRLQRWELYESRSKIKAWFISPEDQPSCPWWDHVILCWQSAISSTGDTAWPRRAGGWGQPSSFWLLEAQGGACVWEHLTVEITGPDARLVIREFFNTDFYFYFFCKTSGFSHSKFFCWIHMDIAESPILEYSETFRKLRFNI